LVPQKYFSGNISQNTVFMTGVHLDIEKAFLESHLGPNLISIVFIEFFLIGPIFFFSKVLVFSGQTPKNDIFSK